MYQLTLYAYQGFVRGGGSSGGVGIGGGGRMHPWRCDGCQRGRQKRVASSLSYRPRSEVGGKCGHMILHDRLNQGDGVLCCWWRRNLSAAVHSIGNGGGGEKKRKLAQMVRNCNE